MKPLIEPAARLVSTLARNLKCRNPMNVFGEYPYSSEIMKFEYYTESI